MSEDTKSYFVKLKNRYPVAEGTMAFELEKPTGFTFTPGQWIDLTIHNPSETDEKGNVRGFSIASAPEDEFLTVATRMRDTAFKRVLGKLPLDSEIEITEPGGNFNLHNNPAKTAVFIAGGIGVTPVRSILRHAAKAKLGHSIYFFYSNSTPERSAFLEELGTLQKENRNYKLISTMTEMDKSQTDWRGEEGRIGKEILEKYLTSAKDPIYYIVGPRPMVKAMKQTLLDAGYDSDNIRSEGFGGY